MVQNSYDEIQVQIPLQKSMIEIFWGNSYDPWPYNIKTPYKTAMPALLNLLNFTDDVDPIAFTIINLI